MWWHFALASALIFGLGSFLFKISADKKCLSEDVLFGLYFSGFIVLLISSNTIDLGEITLISLLAGAIIAVGSVLGNSLYMKVLQLGPASLSAPLINSSNLLVIIMAIVFFNEQLTPMMMLGIGLFFIALALLTFDPNEKFSIQNKKWYVFLILAVICIFLRDGGLKIGHEMGLNMIAVLLYAYCYACFFNGFLMVRRQNIIQHNTLYGVGLGMLLGIFSAGGLALYAHALTIGPASLVAPIFATRSFVVVILAMLICKERISNYQAMAILLLLIAGCVTF